MKWLVVGAHLQREDIEPLAEALPVASLFLSALEVPDDQPLGDRELLLRVASVRARLLEAATFVAIRYGFTARSKEGTASACATRVEQWRALLESNRANVEMTLKVAATTPRTRPDRALFASGAAYLRALHEATRAADVPASLREAAGRLLVPRAVSSRWIHRDERSLELVLLVERTRVAAMLEAGEDLRREAAAVPFLLSGPWPLEVFADDHE